MERSSMYANIIKTPLQVLEGVLRGVGNCKKLEIFYQNIFSNIQSVYFITSLTYFYRFQCLKRSLDIGFCIWGIITELEGYYNPNHARKSRAKKFLKKVFVQRVITFRVASQNLKNFNCCSIVLTL